MAMVLSTQGTQALVHMVHQQVKVGAQDPARNLEMVGAQVRAHSQELWSYGAWGGPFHIVYETRGGTQSRTDSSSATKMTLPGSNQVD
ncbi:hypothetical protein Tco_0975027 [Tanacetum coccineum]|uniref:Uncharacterized protein n=1 Tax=Tanacetum coccineum TaxID=301880 RepID=A0ABQ5EDA0_9ASTR